MVNIPETVKDALAAAKAAIEEVWAALDADEHLDRDEQAEVTMLVEGAGDNIDAAKKIVHDNAERE